MAIKLSDHSCSRRVKRMKITESLRCDYQPVSNRCHSAGGANVIAYLGTWKFYHQRLHTNVHQMSFGLGGKMRNVCISDTKFGCLMTDPHWRHFYQRNYQWTDFSWRQQSSN